MSTNDEQGRETAPAPGGDNFRGSPEDLRSRLRAALRRHIDPDDDTMPALWRGGFIWHDVDSVLDGLVAAVGEETRQLTADCCKAMDAVERVRNECAAIGTPHICNAVDRILNALDTEEAP